MDKRVLLAGVIVLSLSYAVAASTIPQMSQVVELNQGLKTVAAALGVLIITHAGLRWIAAGSPQERDDAKKTIVYVIVGLIIVNMSEYLVAALYKW